MRKQAFNWPNNHRVAMVVSVLLETWSEGHSPSYFPRTSPMRAGTTDIAGHGYYQDQLLAYMTPDEQRATIRKTLDALEKASGRRPTGWVTPIYGWTEETMDLLLQEKIVWASDALDASMPYRQKTPSGSIVIIPWSDFVDNRVLRASPRIYYDVYKDTFDYLYACEPGGLINIGIHSHFGGRPLMAAMFRNILQYLKSIPDVWFARHDEIAQWMHEQGVENPFYASRFFRDA